MKKAKLMLSVIAILAVVGGAAAFKAKAFSTLSYCYSSTYTAAAPKTAAAGSIVVLGSTVKYYYTTTSNFNACLATTVLPSTKTATTIQAEE